ASVAEWPSEATAYFSAFRENGSLSVTSDRLEAADELMRTWFNLAEAMLGGVSTTPPLKNLLQSLSFLDVAARKGVQIQGHRAWTHEVSMKIPESGSWFLPPVFGSRSNDRYDVVVMQGTVLME